MALIILEREFAASGKKWTVAWASDGLNHDNYNGLDNFWRIDELAVKTATVYDNRYQYTFDYNSKVTLREDLVGNVAGVYVFDEDWTYDNLERVTEHRRGDYSYPTWYSYPLFETFSYDCFSNITQNISLSILYTFNYNNEIKSRNGDITSSVLQQAWQRVHPQVEEGVHHLGGA